MATEKDRLSRFLLPGAHARGAIIRADNIVQEANRLHGLTGIPAEMFGQSLIASILLLSISKGGMRQVLQLDAHPEQLHAPVKRILAEARFGMVRGYLNWGESGLRKEAGHDHGISTWMGSPIRTTVVRDLGVGHPYVSSIEHDSDYLADHILHFLTQSVQTRSDIILHGRLGILLEAMPGSDEEHWFKAVESMAAISNKKLETSSPEELLESFSALGCKIVGEDAYAYQCSCKPESLIAALQNIPAEQLADLVSEKGTVTLSCQYCNSSHEIAVDSARPAKQ